MPGNLEKYASQYFTGTQATIWLGDTWVDECVGIHFQANQSIIPIFGYASSKFDAVARGKVLVQGQFEINFVDEGYLYAVLEQHARDAAIANPRPTDKVDIIKDQLDLLKEVNEQAAVAGDNSVRERSRRDIMSSVIRDLANLDVASVDQLGTRLSEDADLNLTESVIYRMIPFRLTGYFGNPEVYGKNQGAFKEIKECFLVSNEMIVGSNDEPIKERYSFIAREHI